MMSISKVIDISPEVIDNFLIQAYLTQPSVFLMMYSANKLN